ncbi:MAG: 50S ribosomal protein L13 [Candidatus Moraniibacteriota bacterium]
MNKSTSYKYTEKPRWHLMDAKTQIFGRLASRIAGLLQGKNKPIYSPQTDCGDFVILINTKYLKLSHPSKWDNKIYYHYSGYPGGIKDVSIRDAVDKNPNIVIRKAIIGMLPKNKLRTTRINRLKMFTGGKEGKELYEAMKKKAK